MRPHKKQLGLGLYNIKCRIERKLWTITLMAVNEEEVRRDMFINLPHAEIEQITRVGDFSTGR